MYRIAVDTGGTFTDVAVSDPTGGLTIGKALTTPERVFQGIEAALANAAEILGTDVHSLLADTNVFIYGTTHTTNAIIVGKTARTALLCTEGFKDVLVLREGGKANPFEFATAYPEPYIPRRLTFELRERIDAEGNVVVPLDAEHARLMTRALHDRGVEAIAVALIWSVANPEHEEKVAELIEEELPGIPYTLSHRLNPIVREYRRTSSAAIDASLKPLMQHHLSALQQDLRDAGFAGELLAVSSLGGSMHIDDLIERPIYSVKSGPSMAPVAGRTYAEAELANSDAVVCDTGGTSFDVSLIRDGWIKETRETWLGPRFSGHMTGLSSVDVKSIGSGGGSIAWVDPGSLLRVGPQSAGADPGPACYGRGGTEATVTDAAVVTGYIDPDYFLGGRMRLDRHAAVQAVEAIGRRLGLSVEQAAHAILAIANEHMVGAISEITINEGVDPRESVIVAGGGAAGLNIIPIARELGCRTVLVPRTAGALSACGGQFSNVIGEFSVSRYAHTSDFGFSDVNAALETIDATLGDFAERLKRRGLERFEREYLVEARYPSQAWELEVPLPSDRFRSDADVDALTESFHSVHERVFAVKEEGQDVECLYWKGRLTALLDRPRLEPEMNGSAHHQPEPRVIRKAFFAEAGEVETPRYFGAGLKPGTELVGPAVIDEPTTTIVVYPGSMARVTDLHNYLIAIE